MKRPQRIVFVSKNPGKIREVRFILEKFGIGVAVAELTKIEIQAESSTEIAFHSARQLLSEVGEPFIVEDAGLYVTSLGGFPGPYSHYVLDKIGCQGIVKLLVGSDSRRAYFESAVAFARNDGTVKTFIGRVDGTISQEVRGREGFGFDPIFVPNGGSETFGEVSVNEKSEMSHRQRSLEAFANWYLARNLAATQS